MMTSEEIRNRFLSFFERRGHKIIPSASLVPENDPSVLFTTAGMQPLVPYLLGEPHPKGRRLVSIQKCVRTQDIEEVGDNTHDTFFEMLGNWSLGDYFKKEAIVWSYEFLTSKDEGLGLNPNRLYVTVFEGDDNAPKDEESYAIWKDIFERAGLDPEKRIFFMPAENNWWSPGSNGPCGPDTEMFYDVTGALTEGLTKEEFVKADDEQKIVEVWNDVFMEYEKKDGKVIGKLSQKNVDTGAGLERLAMVMQGTDNVFETDLFKDIIFAINAKAAKTPSVFSPENLRKAERIVADHIRTSVFIVSDGVVPSNTDRGYVLRRLLRRATRYADMRGLEEEGLIDLVDIVIKKYKNVYPSLKEGEEKIKEEIRKEIAKFRKTLAKGLKEFEKIAMRLDGGNTTISGKVAFDLFQTYGFPLELIREVADEKSLTVDEAGFYEEFKRHQEASRKGAEKKFKGGLADTSEMSVRYHTATHMLHKALREVLGEHVFQKGSNITPERLRFDFSHPQKMTDEEKRRVEELVNQKIQEALPVSYEDISLEEAKRRGALGVFDEKYKDTVRVYKIGDDHTGVFSLEICGGPHVQNTSELGVFKIVKEEASSAGVRRIKAVLLSE